MSKVLVVLPRILVVVIREVVRVLLWDMWRLLIFNNKEYGWPALRGMVVPLFLIFVVMPLAVLALSLMSSGGLMVYASAAGVLAP
jgi:hypothetical protein